MTTPLTIDGLRAVLAAFDHPEGIEAGGFTMGLIRAGQHADRLNADRLAHGFPELGIPLRLIRFTTSGTETVAAALALMIAGVEIRPRDIDALGDADPDPTERHNRAKVAWLHQDILHMELPAIIEREVRLAAQVKRPPLRIVSDRRRADGAAGTSRKPR